jgi:hypothetical protein
MNTVANNAQKRQNLNFYNLLTPNEILQVFDDRRRREACFSFQLTTDNRQPTTDNRLLAPGS